MDGNARLQRTLARLGFWLRRHLHLFPRLAELHLIVRLGRLAQERSHRPQGRFRNCGFFSHVR
jgi:hypothetical protein